MKGEGRRIYPGTGSILFDGGLNTKFEKSIIEDNESPSCANVIFSNGAVETRQGVTKLNTTSVGSFLGDGIYTRRANDGSETMIVWAGGSMWTLGGTTFSSVPSATSVFTAGVRMAAVMQENYMFFCNGNVIPYKWNGTEFTRHGVYPPTTTCTVASNATGILTGDYRYKVTMRNSNLVESDVGPVTSTLTAASATIRISSIPTAPASHGVNARRIYRTAAGGSTFKLVTTLSDNTTTTYDDSTADASLGANAPTDNGVPPKYSFCIYHESRLFVNDAANPNYVWYSNLNDPYTFASTNYFIVGDKTSDLVKGLAVQDGSVIVFCERSATIVYMPDTDPTNWVYKQAKTEKGTRSPFGIIRYQNKNLFPAIENSKFVGFAALAGDAVEPSATVLSVASIGSELKSERIEPDMFEVQETYLGNISAIVYKNRAYISLTYGSDATANNRIYVMDFSRENISKHQKEAWSPWTGLNAAQFTIYNGNLYYLSTTTGFVYKMEAGVYSDDGSAIDSYFWTKEYPGFTQDIGFNKDHRYVKMLVDQAGDYYMNFTYRTDSDRGDGTTQQVYLNPGSSLWGTMVFGRDSWGGGSYQDEKTVYLAGARGTRIQFKFSNRNTAGQRFKVHRLNYAYNKKGFR